MWPFKKKKEQPIPCENTHVWRFLHESRQKWGYKENGEHYGAGRTIESFITYLSSQPELKLLMEKWQALGYNGVHTSLRHFRCLKCGARMEEEFYEPYIISAEALANAKKRLPIEVKVVTPKTVQSKLP